MVWSGAAFLVLAVVGNGLQPEVDPLPGLSPVHNPVVYLPAAKPLLDLLLGLTVPCALVGLGGAVAALVVRFRRARGIERQQLKWFTFAAALTPLPFGIYEFAPGIFQLLFTLALPLVPISVGIATLTAAAIFRPARRRIQAAVDRRFNHRRYDAAMTVEAFGARMHEQVDLDTLSAELVAVIGLTMEPASVSLWLRPPATR